MPAHRARPDRGASYRDVFAVREFRFLFAAYLLSLLGDQLAKIAVTVVVYERTGSALLAAVTFAVGYLPWVAGGPVLSALADRLPRRRVLIACDLARCVLVASLALPGTPLPVLLVVLFAAALLTPPFDSARAALLPEVLDGDRYVVASALGNICVQTAQVAGFALGGAAVAVTGAHGALFLDALTFLLSAALIRRGVRSRPAAALPGRRPSLLRESGEGVRLLVGDRRLRAYVALTCVASAFAYAAEGLAAPYAAQLGGGPRTVGLLLAANPLGVIAGLFVVSRLAGPRQRDRLVLPLAVLSCAALLPIALGPGLGGALALLALSGTGMAFLTPVNARLVVAVPAALRGRVFGVAQSVLQVSQGLAVVVAGALAGALAPQTVIALAGLVGTLAVLWLASRWPDRRSAASAASAEPVHAGRALDVADGALADTPA